MIENDIPFFTKCKFGYYEWFAKRVKGTVTIYRIPVLASKGIFTDEEYRMNLSYPLSLNNKDKDCYLDRAATYEYVKKYWDKKYIPLGYMKIKERK